MLGHENDIHSRGLQCLHPLFGVELRGVEHLRIGGAIAPFAVEKRVWSKMDNCSHFQILPRNLLWRRLHIDEVLALLAASAIKTKKTTLRTGIRCDTGTNRTIRVGNNEGRLGKE